MRLCWIILTGLLLLRCSSAFDSSFIFSRSCPFRPTFTPIFSQCSSFPPYCIWALADGPKVLTVEANKCLIVAGEGWPHSSGNLSHFDTEVDEEEEEEMVWGLKELLGSRWEGKHEGGVLRKNISRWERWAQRALWDVEEEDEQEKDQGPTSAVATGNLIYLMSSWLLFLPGPGLQKNTKRTLLFPPSALSPPSPFTTLLLNSVNTHLSRRFGRCSTLNRGWKGKQLNQPKEGHWQHFLGGSPSHFWGLPRGLKWASGVQIQWLKSFKCPWKSLRRWQ